MLDFTTIFHFLTFLWKTPTTTGEKEAFAYYRDGVIDFFLFTALSPKMKWVKNRIYIYIYKQIICI